MLLRILYLLTVMGCIMVQSSSDALKNSKGGCVIDGKSIRCRKANSTELETILTSVMKQSNRSTIVELPEELSVLDSHIDILRERWLGQLPLRNLRIAYSHLADWHFLPHSLSGLEGSLQRLSLEGNYLTTIPQSVQNLSALRHLDLSHNNIQVLPPGSLFFHLHQLLHLSLAYNNLGYLETVQQRQLNTSTKPFLLSLTLFNLEPLRESLETLQLENNNLTLFPEQFLRPFPRLFSLNLAENHLTNIPRDAFQYIPELEVLHLASNRLKTLDLLILPSKLNLQGNPLRCDCNAAWLLQWLHQTAHNAVDTAKAIPLCQTPLKLKGLNLATLTNDLLCSATPVNEFRYIGDEDLDKLPQLSLHITPSFRTPFTSQEDGKHYLKLTVKPNISDPNSHRKWILAYRRLGNDSSGQYTPIPSSSFNDSYLALNPNASYAICIAVEDLDIYYIHPSFCQEVLLPLQHADFTKLPQFNHETSHSPLLHFIPTSNSVQLQRMDANCATYYGWLVRHRTMIANNEPPWILSNFSSCTAELQDLRSSETYQICWQLPATPNWLCQQIRTLPDLKTAFMTQEVALAAGVSSSTTFILITLVGCCCCRRKKTSKNAKKGHKIPEPFVCDRQKPNSSTNSLSLRHKENGRSMYASLTRLYHKCQSVRPSASKQAQQEATFEAMKRYLQHKTQDFAFGSLTLQNTKTHTGTPSGRRNKPSALALWTGDGNENASSGYLTPNSDQWQMLRPLPQLKLTPAQTLRAPAKRYGTVTSNWRLDSRDKVHRRTPARLSRNKYYTWTTTASRLLPTANQTLIKTNNKMFNANNQMSNNANNQNHKRQPTPVTLNPLYLFPQPLSSSELHF